MRRLPRAQGEGRMSYKFSEPHPYVDLSKRKPYICGVCLRQITDPIHQPALPGTVTKLPESPRYDYWATPEPTEPDEYGHSPGDPCYGIDDRQLSIFDARRISA